MTDNTRLYGTWRLNETINISLSVCYVNFTCVKSNGSKEEYKAIGNYPSSSWFCYFVSTNIYEGWYEPYQSNGWGDEGARTISISTETNDTLLTWLHSNAVKLSDELDFIPEDEEETNYAQEFKTLMDELNDVINDKAKSSGKKVLSEIVETAKEIEAGVDTTDATATSNDIRIGKTAYVNEVKVEGTIENYDGSYDGEAEDTLMPFLDGTLKDFSNNNLLSVRDYTFRSFYELSNVNLPKCENIGTFAFASCKKLKKVDTPNCLTIGSSTFISCSNLSLVNASNCLTIGAYAFANCVNLETINCEDVISIGNSAFLSCTNLTDINMPNLLYAGAYTFAYCKKISEVKLPLLNSTSAFAFASGSFKYFEAPATYLSSYAFSFCYNLNECVIAPSTIISNTFYYCDSLSKLKLLTFVCPLSNVNAFTNTPIASLTGSIYVPSNAVESFKASTNWTTYADIIQSLPSEFDSKYVYGYEYYNNQEILNIPSEKVNAEYVLQSAFYSCKNLAEANFNKCIFVGAYAFANCVNLETINLPNCRYVGSYAFSNCSNLTNFSLPNCLGVDYYAFSKCSNLTIIDLPECIFLNSNAFSNCSNITYLNMPKFRGDYSSSYYYIKLMGNTKLSTAYLDNLLYLYSEAFANCYSLIDVRIPNCLSIGKKAFEYCSALSQINLSKCKYIDTSAFRSTALTSVDLLECEFIGNYAFFVCKSLININAPKCSYIGSSAFANCSKLKNIYLSNCEWIGERAFENNIFSVLSLPKCSYIGSYAFTNTYTLKSLYLDCDFIPTLTANALDYTGLSGSDGRIYVRQSMVETFKIAENWSKYASNIVALEGEV